MQFCASFPVCHVCLMEEEEEEEENRLLSPELEPHFAAASFLPVRHGSSLARSLTRSLARSLAAGFIILRGGGAMVGEEEEEEDEVDYVDGVWAVGTPLRVGAMRQ